MKAEIMIKFSPLLSPMVSNVQIFINCGADSVAPFHNTIKFEGEWAKFYYTLLGCVQKIFPRNKPEIEGPSSVIAAGFFGWGSPPKILGSYFLGRNKI